MPTESGDYFSKIRTAESSGNDSAKNPLSSATGRYQFTTGTWNQLAKQYPQLGLTPDGRNDPEQQERAIRAFTSQNAGVLGNAGIEATNPNLYAAHFLGAGGATKVLSQADNAPVATIVGQSVVKANPFLANMTVGDFKNWTAKKVGGNGDGVQVASLDPSAGMAEAYAPAQPQNEVAEAIHQIAPQQNNYPEAGKVPPVDWTDQPQLSQAAGLSFSKGIGQEDQRQQMASLPSQPFISPVAPPQPQQQPPQSMNGISAQGMAAHDQMMGGMFAPQGGQPVQVADSSGYFPPAPDNSQSKPVQSGDRMQFYARQLSNPFLSPENKKLAMFRYQQELERQQQASDPMYQMGLEKSRLELDAMKNPKKKVNLINAGDGRLYDADNGTWLTAPNAGIPESTPDQRNYEYSVEQLRKRGVPDDKIPTFQEWAKPKSNGISFTSPDGTQIQIGGNNGGMDGTSIPAEIGSRVGLGQRFLTDDYPGLIEKIKAGKATGPLAVFDARVGRGDAGIVYRRMATGVDALRRGLTGAGMSGAETEEYADRYSPQWSDNAETLQRKAEGLKADLEAVSAGAIKGKAGKIADLLPGGNVMSGINVNQSGSGTTSGGLKWSIEK
jgi:hypothetical protein